MHFLIDASLPRSAALVLRQLGYEATDVRDVGMRAAPDSTIAEYAKRHRLALVTRDFDFADIRNYPPGALSRRCRPQASRGRYGGAGYEVVDRLCRSG
jgi:predicted nuclease of predicted toxin-antitoxin system